MDFKMKYTDRTKRDWQFSDKVHEKVMEVVYGPTSGLVIKASEKDDLSKGIDYLFFSKNRQSDKPLYIQERFRELNKYTASCEEFTLRFRRSNSLSDTQKLSEFFKIKAHCLVYGVTSEAKQHIEDGGDFNLKHVVVIKLKKLMKAIDNGLIIIDNNEDNQRSKPYLKDERPVAIVKHNKEDKLGNSSMLVFNFKHLLLVDELKDIVASIYVDEKKIDLKEETRKIREQFKKHTSQTQFLF